MLIIKVQEIIIFPERLSHMSILSFVWNLETLSNLISIATPVVLLAWFYISEFERHSVAYYKELNGIYAGYDALNQKDPSISGGFILNIRTTDNKGYFKGELAYRTLKRSVDGYQIQEKILKDGTFLFYGKMHFDLHLSKARNPFDHRKNRKYVGFLYIVDRFDFLFETYDIKQFSQAEYKVEHLREMEFLRFTQVSVKEDKSNFLPQTFELHKKLGIDFEPYANIKQEIFKGFARVDS